MGECKTSNWHKPDLNVGNQASEVHFLTEYDHFFRS